MTLDRRRFLLSLGLLAGAPADALETFSASQADSSAHQDSKKAATPSPASTPLSPAPPPEGYAAEAARLTDLIWKHYWDPAARLFRASVLDADSVASAPPTQNGCLLWPSLLGLYALVEGEKAHPGRYRARIAEVIGGLEQYYDPALHAYDAWLHFPGNDDAYYDDNAWVVIILAEAYRVAGKPIAWRDRAAEVMEGFLYRGWDDGPNPGGVRWGTKPGDPNTPDRTVSATAGAALAALQLAQLGVNRARNIAWARKALAWVERLRDTDDLVRDGRKNPGWEIMASKWTYNTGVPIRAYVELYRLTGERSSLEMAERLGRAAIDHHKALFDGAVRDPERRYWFDGGYFVHYLVDGLCALYQETHGADLLREIRRNADYAYRYLRDPADGLYFRGWRLWRMGEPQRRTWQTLTGQAPPTDPDPDERSHEARDASKPTADRPLVKTLLSNAGNARLFWLIGGVHRRVAGT